MERRSQPSPPATPTATQQPSRGAWSGRWGEEPRLFGCSRSPVVPSVSATNSGDAALCLRAPARRAAARSRDPRRGRCGRLWRHLRLLSAEEVAWAAAARAPKASSATAAAARAASAAVAASEALARSRPRGSGRMWVLGIAATFCGLFLLQGKTKRPAAQPGASTASARRLLRPPLPPARLPVLRRGCPAGVWRWLVRRDARWESLQVPRCRRRGGSRGFAELEHLRDSSCRCSGYTVGRRSWTREAEGSE